MGFFITDFTDKIKRWPDGYIPYTISNTDFPVGSNNRKIIENAISHWNDMSNVSLVPLNGESDYCVFQLAPLSGVSCQSSVGRIGG